MNTLQKKELATFMNYPTESLKGRITDSLADSKYNDIASLFGVIEKIEKIEIPDKHGNYKLFVKVQGDFCSIKGSRVRQGSGFKDGVFDVFQIAYNSKDTKIEAIQASIIDFLKWYKEYENK